MLLWMVCSNNLHDFLFMISQNVSFFQTLNKNNKNTHKRGVKSRTPFLKNQIKSKKIYIKKKSRKIQYNHGCNKQIKEIKKTCTDFE